MTSILSALTTAINTAAVLPDSGATVGAIHRHRSQAFVSALGGAMRAAVAHLPNIRVFDQSHRGNVREFGLRELLFDILVCEIAPTPSARGVKTLSFIQRALWAVESEFREDSREAVCDFNKLVLCSSENKLFIAPVVSDSEAYLGALAPLAEAATAGDAVLFCALISHPSQWADRTPSPQLYRFARNAWIPDGGEHPVA